jgi:hypothetical protein
VIQHRAKFFDPTVAAILTLTSFVSVGVLTNALCYVLKAAFIKKRREPPRKHLKITQIEQPDGTDIVIVEQDEQ